MVAPCAHGMPTPAACYECMEDGNLEPPARPEPVSDGGFSIEAAYETRCLGCDRTIRPGDAITRMTDGSWRHRRCS